MTTFLDDIAGVRDLQLNDGPLVPRRNVLHIIGSGITLTDDVAAGETRLVIPEVGLPQQGAQASYGNTPTVTNLECGVTDPDARRYINTLRLTTSAPVTIMGIRKDFSPRIVLINASSQTFTLAHNAGSPDPGNNIRCALSTAYALQGGRCVELVRDAISNCWRTVL